MNKNGLISFEQRSSLLQTATCIKKFVFLIGNQYLHTPIMTLQVVNQHVCKMMHIDHYPCHPLSYQIVYCNL